MNTEKRKTILVVEDDPEYRMLLRARLQSYGFNIIEAEDGITGVELVRSQSPDLILLDVMLPRMNGFEVAKIIKKYGPRNIPLIMLTALADERSKKTGISAGADAYLTKSCDSSLLLNKISDILKNEQSK